MFFPLLLFGGIAAALLYGSRKKTEATAPLALPPIQQAQNAARALATRRKRRPDEKPVPPFEDPRRYRRLAGEARKRGKLADAMAFDRKADSLNLAIRIEKKRRAKTRAVLAGMGYDGPIGWDIVDN